MVKGSFKNLVLMKANIAESTVRMVMIVKTSIMLSLVVENT